MKRILPISKMPFPATDTPVEVWLTLIRDFIDALIPFFTTKDPNPVPLVPEDDSDS